MATTAWGSGSLALKMAFMLASSWAIVVAFSAEIETMLNMNPFSEGAPAHGLYEIIVLLAVLSAMGFTCIVAYKQWPTFLQVRRDVSMVAVLWRLVAVVPVLFAVVGLVVFALTWLFVVRAEEPADPQYGLSAWWAAYYYALMLTSIITVVGVWLQLRCKYRE